MPFTLEDFGDLKQLLEQQPEWRAELRQLLLPDEVLSLPQIVQALAEAQLRTETRLAAVETQIARLVEAQHRTEERVTALAEAQHRTEERITALAEAQLRTEARLAAVETQIARLVEAQNRTEELVTALAEAQKRTEERITALVEAQTALTQDVQLLTKRVDTLSQDVGGLKGDLLELRYRNRAPAYFRGLAHRLRTLPDHELDAFLDEAVQAGKLTEAEADQIMEADIVVRGRRREDGAEVYLVVEVSWGVGPHDVERAAERAALLAKTGLLTIPVVAGKVITYEAANLARWKRTWQVLDGQTIAPTELPLEFAGMVH